MPATRVRCPWCGRRPALTPNGRLWAHGAPRCDGSGTTPGGRQPTTILTVDMPRRLWGRPIRTVPITGGLL
jgi:hypothetical protein